jgi:L-fuculose-phosphate aldolase
VRVNLALHRATYRARSDVGAIIEGAPVAVTAFGVTAVPLPSRTIPESYFLLRDVPTITMTEYANAEAPLSATVPVALIRGRGAIALGTTALDAFDRLEVAEATAAAAMLTRALGPLVPLTDRAAADLAAAYFRDPE